MPIAENFPEGLKPTGKINLDDGNFHIMWGPGKTANADGSKAETLAESEIVEYRKNEQVHQGIYDFGKIILHQVNEVLSSLQQDISQLKAEYHASL